MSTDLAVTAVTRTLRQILEEEVASHWGPDVPTPTLNQGFVVDHLLPHKVRDTHQAKNILNVFLYRTDLNAGWRNMPLPTQAKPGENVTPPLALNLEYLVMAYGEDDREDAAHFFLAQAMRVLHDMAVIPRGKFKDVLEKARVHQQIEQVTITPKALSIEEMSKLWSILGTQFRISAAYLVTVVLIDSRAAAKSVLPVLKRGPDDSGVLALAGPLPVLDSAKPASGFAAARLGEKVTLRGERLDMSGLTARVRHPLVSAPVDLPVTSVDATRATIALPSGAGIPGTWPAGLYSVALSGTLPNNVAWATNAVSFPLAPAITVTPTLVNAPGGTFEVTIEATPQVRDGQQVTALYGSRQIAPKSLTTPANDDDPTTVVFDAPEEAGLHRVRLRVDGIDSIPIVKDGEQLKFDDAQSVQVNP